MPRSELYREIQGRVASVSHSLGCPGQWVINFLSVLALLIMHTSEQLWGFKTLIIIVLRDLYNPRTEKQCSHLTRTDPKVVTESPGASPAGGRGS